MTSPDARSKSDGFDQSATEKAAERPGGTMHLDQVELRGRRISLEPVRNAHLSELQAALNCDEEGWTGLPRSGFGDAFPAFWKALISSPGRIPYAVRDLGSGLVVGTSSFVDVDPQNATLEIGGTWFRPETRGTFTNPEAKLLMLSRAFDADAERVQFKVDTRNARSLRALARLGAVHEGTIRKHLVTWTGFRRDSAILSVLRSEWPAVRAGLIARLDR